MMLVTLAANARNDRNGDHVTDSTADTSPDTTWQPVPGREGHVQCVAYVGPDEPRWYVRAVSPDGQEVVWGPYGDPQSAWDGHDMYFGTFGMATPPTTPFTDFQVVRQETYAWTFVERRVHATETGR